LVAEGVHQSETAVDTLSEQRDSISEDVFPTEVQVNK
jgi:hypothetical protein